MTLQELLKAQGLSDEQITAKRVLEKITTPEEPGMYLGRNFKRANLDFLQHICIGIRLKSHKNKCMGKHLVSYTLILK